MTEESMNSPTVHTGNNFANIENTTGAPRAAVTRMPIDARAIVIQDGLSNIEKSGMVPKPKMAANASDDKMKPDINGGRKNANPRSATTIRTALKRDWVNLDRSHNVRLNER